MPYIAMPKMACCKEINRKKNPGITPNGVMPDCKSVSYN